MKLHKPQLTENRVQNFITLATYLKNLPKDYEHFDMGTYFTSKYDGSLGEVSPVAAPSRIDHCGSAACAVGHGPSAGIDPGENYDWSEYVETNFCNVSSLFDIKKPYSWCFHFGWEIADNSPHGAAARILYMLEHGIPVELFKSIRRVNNINSNTMTLTAMAKTDFYRNDVLGMVG